MIIYITCKNIFQILLDWGTSQSKLHVLPKFETNKNKSQISNKVMNNTSSGSGSGSEV